MYKVLLVDDEKLVIQGLARFVPWNEAGYAVAGTATSVARALTFLENETVDLVITDIQMPVQNGLDLLRILKEQYPHVKTIILSGYSEFAYAQQALRLGALDYLTKPVNFGAMKALLERVRATLDEENARDDGDSKMQELLAHTLIMNFANGLAYDEARAAACLDTHCPVTVVRIGSKEAAIPEELALLFRTRFAPCQVVTPGAAELLVVLEGERCFSDLRRELNDVVEQYAAVVPLCAGVSAQHAGYRELRQAALQAGKAMRYQNARSSTGVTLYEQVRGMFLETSENSDAVIRRLVELLSTPEKRPQLIPAVSASLSSLETHPDFSLAAVQRFCTELLVEMDAPIQSFALSDYPRHALLSEALMDVLSAQSVSEAGGCMEQYLQQLLQRLSAVDETKLAGELIDRVKEYIQGHYAENLTLAVLSERFYVSPVYLSRLFKRKNGTNFVEYLTALRIEKAKEFLRDPDRKIYHVAELVGYENPRYFARLFKDATGCSPQEYRSMGERS